MLIVKIKVFFRYYVKNMESLLTGTLVSVESTLKLINRHSTPIKFHHTQMISINL